MDLIDSDQQAGAVLTKNRGQFRHLSPQIDLGSWGHLPRNGERSYLHGSDMPLGRPFAQFAKVHLDAVFEALKQARCGGVGDWRPPMFERHSLRAVKQGGPAYPARPGDDAQQTGCAGAIFEPLDKEIQRFLTPNEMRRLCAGFGLKGFATVTFFLFRFFRHF